MTQLQQVARHIVQYGEITRNTAIGMYQITRLAAVTHEMFKRGIPVISEPIYQGRRIVDWRYTYRTDYLERLRALKTAAELLERFGWQKKAI